MTPLIEKTPSELVIEQAEVAAQIKFLAGKQKEIQFQLSEVNNLMKGKKLPHEQYHKLMAHRKNLCGSRARIEKDFTELRQKSSAVHAVMEVKKRDAIDPKTMHRIVGIRDSWHEFSMDKANHQKAREVAFKVSQELRELLKPYFEANA